MSYAVRFTSRAAEFWAWAGDHLSADPVVSTVVTTVAQRAIRHGDPEPVDGVPSWYAVVTGDRGEVVGVAMRTAPEPPYAPYVLAMPDAAAEQLAVAIRGRGETVEAINGALPSAQVVAEAFGVPSVAERNRLWELRDLIEPAAVPGRLRPATPDPADVALAISWFDVFGAEAAEQATHEPPPASESVDGADMLRRIADGRVHFWEVDGEPVHLTGSNPPAHGVARIGPVYTPGTHRGRGYAAAAVVGVARMLRGNGARVCLFTDEANPVSNRLYARLGFEPVTDMVRLIVEPLSSDELSSQEVSTQKVG